MGADTDHRSAQTPTVIKSCNLAFRTPFASDSHLTNGHPHTKPKTFRLARKGADIDAKIGTCSKRNGRIEGHDQTTQTTWYRDPAPSYLSPSCSSNLLLTLQTIVRPIRYADVNHPVIILDIEVILTAVDDSALLRKFPSTAKHRRLSRLTRLSTR